MKTFWVSVLAIAVITVVAWAVFGTVDMSSQTTYSSSHGSVRL